MPDPTDSAALRSISLSREDWRRLLAIAHFTYTEQDERILNAIQKATEAPPA